MAKVLVVEDDNNLREIYETSLKAEGYETSSAADGMEALELAGRNKPDLIISDVMMPRLSGFEMLEKLRQDDNLKDVPVIMMTALSMAEDKETAKRLGVVHYLVKSQVTLEDFVSVAKKFVPADGTAVAAATTPAPEPTVNNPAPTPAEPTQAATPPLATEPPKPEPVQAAPVTSPAPEPTAAPPVDSTSQTTSQETSAVEAKINDFISSQQAEGAPQAEVQDQTAASAEPIPDKQGKKVIQPSPAPEKTDINELAKAEEAKDASSQPSQPPSAGSSIDPNSIAL